MLSGHDDAVTSLVFLGDALVSASRDGTIRVWDVAARRAVGGVQAHTSWVNCCALSVDGRSLVSVGTDGMIRVWDVPLLEQGQVRGHVDWVNDLTVTGDGTQIASGGNDHTVRLWSADDGRPDVVWRAPSKVWGLSFDTTGDVLAVAAVSTLHLLRRSGSQSFEVVSRVSAAAEGVNSASFSPSGEFVAALGLNGTIWIRAVRSLESAPIEFAAPRKLNAVCFVDEKTVFFGGLGGELFRWEFETATPAPVTMSSCGIQALQVFGGGSAMACVTSSEMRVLDVRTAATVQVLPIGDGVNDGSVSTDGRWLAVAGEDGELRVFCLRSGVRVATMRVDGALYRCRWRPDSHDVFAAGRRGVYAFTFRPAGVRGHR